MFLVRTYLATSSIHGLGVFAAERIAEGQAVWQFMPGVDLVLEESRVADYPDAFRRYLAAYGYPSPDLPGRIVLSCDNAKYLNHAETPNCESSGPLNRALRSIGEGEEITCDYRLCVAGWSGFA